MKPKSARHFYSSFVLILVCGLLSGCRSTESQNSPDMAVAEGAAADGEHDHDAEQGDPHTGADHIEGDGHAHDEQHEAGHDRHTERFAFVFLEAGDRGEDLSDDEVQIAAVGHRENIERLAEEGVLLLAGPFGMTKLAPQHRGIFVFDLADVEQAKLLTATDPAVEAGVLGMRAFPWSTDAPLRRVRELAQARKERGEAFKGLAYVLGIGTPADAARKSLAELQIQGRVPFAGELGAERSGQLLFALSADSIPMAQDWIGALPGSTEVSWKLSNWYATEFVMQLID